MGILIGGLRLYCLALSPRIHHKSGPPRENFVSPKPQFNFGKGVILMDGRTIGISNSRPSIILWSGVALVTWLGILALYFLSPDSYVWLGTEDKFGEDMTSVFYFGAGFLMLWRSGSQIRNKQTTTIRELVPVLIALFFIFVGGEEISWGQRLFGFETPEVIIDNNVQGESTLHNLSFFDRGGAVLNQHTILNLIALFMGVIIPISFNFSPPLRRLLSSMNFPAPPLAVTMWFIVGLVHGQTIAKAEPHWSHTEVKELIFAVGFFLYGWSFFKGTNED